MACFNIFNIFDNNQINSRKSVKNLLWLVLISFDVFNNNQINSRKSVMACFNIFDVFDNNQINSRKSVMACFNIFNVFDNNQINSRKSVRNLLWLVLISSTSLTIIK